MIVLFFSFIHNRRILIPDSNLGKGVSHKEGGSVDKILIVCSC